MRVSIRTGGLAALALLALLTVGASTAATRNSDPRVAFLSGGRLVVLDLSTGTRRIALAQAPVQALAWSGDGRLLSDGGRIVGGPTLPTTTLDWSPTGETAAYQTKAGAVMLWTPAGGSRTILPASWGASSFAWGANGELGVGRSTRARHDVWIWKRGRLTRVATATGSDPRPIVAGLDGRGRVLWWNDPYSSASLAADGLTLYANGTKLAQTLVFPDYVAHCGGRLAVAAGNDRYTTDGKRILLQGRDVSRDPSRSWVSPACNSTGTLVAAAGRNWVEPRIGLGERRTIWELEPQRAQLTHPPAGWTDENPRMLADGSILFVRTRETTTKDASTGTWRTVATGRLELIAGGRTRLVGTTSWTGDGFGGSYVQYYGHYRWPWLVAVTS
ncbi:MAG TPA: hypothetical protein VHZ77_01390 [Gaiellaceae bacterium]|nr:hypothetical protein [Gaiellaceae bacterium]